MEGASSASESCSIGLDLKDDCHKTAYSKTTGLILETELSQENKRMLEWRSGLTLSDESTICVHHEQLFLTLLESLQKYCCDPLNVQKNKIKGKLL